MAEQKNHVKVNLTEAGSLQDVLMDTDYDRIDSLTISGKFSGVDLAYLKKGSGRLASLEFIDLTNIEIVECDEPYYSWRDIDSNIGGYGNPPVHIYYLSNTEYTTSEQTGALASQQTKFYHHTPNLDYGFCGNMSDAQVTENYTLKEVRMPKASRQVGEYMCMNCQALERAVLPEGCKQVGYRAFMWCQNLTDVVNTEQIDSIGAGAFYYTQIDAQFAPLKYIGKGYEGAFDNNTRLKAISFADGIPFIPKRAFANCYSLEELVIPGSVESIGESAFEGCGGLKKVSIGEGTKTLEAYAFKNCSQASDFKVPTTIVAVGQGSFGNVPIPFEIVDGVSYLNTIAYTVNEETTSIAIREGTTVIADYFRNERGISSVTSVSLPSTLKGIGSYAFYYAGSLSSITLPEGLEYIGEYAFAGAKISSITVPSTINRLGDNAFRWCKNLVRVNWNAIDATIGSEIFGFCSGIEKITFGEGVKRIPNNLCAAGANNSVGECNLYGLVRIILSSTIEEIGDGAFAYCTALKRIDWAENGALKKIGNGAFYYNMAIEEFVFPEGVQEIGNNVFGTGSGYASMQTPLRSITIPSTVTHIGYYMVPNAGCQNVEKIISYVENPQPIGGDLSEGEYAFDYFGGTLYVPYGTKEKYEAQPSWRSRNKAMKIEEFGIPDGISTPVTSEKNSNVTYNLQGQRITETKKGFNIINSKKVLVR